jgi:hypothetical protein
MDATAAAEPSWNAEINCVSALTWSMLFGNAGAASACAHETGRAASRSLERRSRRGRFKTYEGRENERAAESVEHFGVLAPPAGLRLPIMGSCFAASAAP